jgi:hypothetical protein
MAPGPKYASAFYFGFSPAGGASRELSFVPFENLGFSIVPSIRNGNDNLPSFNLAPANRANVFVQKPCLLVIVATP